MAYSICTVYNGTGHALHTRTNMFYGSDDISINPGKKFTFQVHPGNTYIEYGFCREHEINGPVIRCILSNDDMAEWEEISIYTSVDDVDDEWVGTKSRSRSPMNQVLIYLYVTKPTSILSAVSCTHDFTTICKYLFVTCMNYTAST